MKKFLALFTLLTCALIHTASAQFVLNIGSDAGNGSTVRGSLTSNSSIILNDNSAIQWGGTKSTKLGYYNFSGSANGQKVTGQMTIWADLTTNQFSNVWVRINDNPFSNETLTSFTFTASSTRWSFDNYSTVSSTNLGAQWPSGNSALSVSAIPEPSTYAAILGAVSLLGLGIRRRMKK